ncbi:hypothetical protein BH11BAC4_BH11BAC4_18100 [soil metagenome]
MKRQYKIFTLCISLYCVSMLLPNGLLWSCGPSLAADETRFALFRNGLDGNTGLRPFYYSANLFNLSEADPDSLDRKNNCKEWVVFCNKMVKQQDVYSVQYETTPSEFLHAYETGNWSSLENNSFIQWLKHTEHRDVLDYMALAKLAEQVQALPTDPWDTTSITHTVLFDSIATRAVNKILHASSGFLKERYAFQAIKSLHYKSSGEKATINLLNQLYESQLDNHTSIVASWAKVYYAMAQQDNNKKTLNLLKCFDECEEKKRFCFQQIAQKDLTALENSTTSDHTLALINTMRALKNKGRAITEIKKVITHEPNSKYLPLLLSREINKLENWLWSPEMLLFKNNYRMDIPDETTRNHKQLKIQDTKYLVELRTYLETMQETTEGKKPYQQLALIHLYNIEQDTAKANHKLLQLPAFNEPNYETQRLIEKVITIAQSKDITTVAIKEELAIVIARLKKLNPAFEDQLKRSYDSWNHQEDNATRDDLSELFVLLSRAYKQKGDIVTAGLLYTKANITVNNYDGWEENDSNARYRKIAYFDRYASPKDMDRLLQIKKQQHRTAFMQLIVPNVWAKDDFYKDLKGTMLFREKNFAAAMEVFSSMDQHFWANNYEYSDYLPNTSVTHTGGMIPSERSKPLKYLMASKKLIVAEMLGLQNKIAETKNDSLKAILCYRLANSYFNVSYNGKAWMMYSYGKSSGEQYSQNEDNYNWAWYSFIPYHKKYGDDYYGCKTAMATFNKALSLSTNRELSAKCLLALATCDKIAAAYNESKKGDNHNSDVAYNSPYLAQLYKKYGSTVAFKEAAVECPDVRDFAGRRKSK